MTAADVLVVALATARLTRLIRTDTLLNVPRETLQIWAMNRVGPDGRSLLVEWFGCVWCVTVWTAVVVLALWYTVPIVAYVLAVAWVAARLES